MPWQSPEQSGMGRARRVVLGAGAGRQAALGVLYGQPLRRSAPRRAAAGCAGRLVHDFPTVSRERPTGEAPGRAGPARGLQGQWGPQWDGEGTGQMGWRRPGVPGRQVTHKAEDSEELQTVSRR